MLKITFSRMCSQEGLHRHQGDRPYHICHAEASEFLDEERRSTVVSWLGQADAGLTRCHMAGCAAGCICAAVQRAHVGGSF